MNPYPKSKQLGVRRKRKPKGLKRSPMKRRPNKVVRDRERMAFVGSQPCVVCQKIGRTQRSRSHADHIKTRGAGGKEAGNLWPLCASHHDERHRVGLASFEYRYNVSAKAWGLHFEAVFMVERECVWTANHPLLDVVQDGKAA